MADVPRIDAKGTKHGTIDRTVSTAEAERLTPEQLAANKAAHAESMRKAHEASAFGKAQVQKWRVAENAKQAAQGTQAGHHVTDNKNHTKPAEPKRPMVGNDKEFNKKYGSKSWNNGYTN